MTTGLRAARQAAFIEILRKMPPLELTDVDGVTCRADAFDVAFQNFNQPLPVLYQSGYLTLKGYRGDRDLYTLGIPNAEVRTGFANCLYQIVSNTRPDDNGRNIFLEAYYDFRDSGDLPAFIEALKAFFASLPYPWEKDNRNEHYYHSLLYTLLTAFGADVRAEEPTAKGTERPRAAHAQRHLHHGTEIQRYCRHRPRSD